MKTNLFTTLFFLFAAGACAQGALPADELGFADSFDESDTGSDSDSTDTGVEVDFGTAPDRAPIEPPKGGGDPGDCCDPSDEGYCENPWYVDCVCSIDDYCCITSWDDICVAIAVAKCDAVCE